MKVRHLDSEALEEKAASLQAAPPAAPPATPAAGTSRDALPAAAAAAPAAPAPAPAPAAARKRPCADGAAAAADPAATAAPAADPNRPWIFVGGKVMARYRQRGYAAMCQNPDRRFPGTVASINQQKRTCDIKFDDGDRDDAVPLTPS